jgi:hypothetical protein
MKCPFGLLGLNDILNYLDVQPFDYERTWWRLFQKRVVRTKFDIYVLITITWSIYVIINKTKDLLPQT